MKSRKSVWFFVFSYLILLSFTDAYYDYLVYTQVWMPTLCRYEVGCRIEHVETKFLLHGSWPTRFIDYRQPAYCEPQIPLFDSRHLDEVMELEDDMEEYWLSFSSRNRNFWDNQWLKHGICTGWPRRRYINEVVGFYRAHIPDDLFTVLRLARISPRYEDEEIELYTREDFQRAVRNLYREADGENLDLVIGVDCAQWNHLYQIRVCKTQDAHDFIDCPYLGSCPENFRFLKYRTKEELEQQTPSKNIIKIKIGTTIAKGLNSNIGSTIAKESKAESKTKVYGRMRYCASSYDLNAVDSASPKSNKNLDSVPMSIVLIDQDSYSEAAIVLSFGDRFGALLDTMMKEFKDLGFDVLKETVSTEGPVKQTNFLINQSDIGHKIENPDMLERIQDTIISNLLQYHPESSVLLAMGEVSDLKDPEKKKFNTNLENFPMPIVLIDQDSDSEATIVQFSFDDRLGALLYTMKALKDLGLDVSKGTVSTEGPMKQTKFLITQSDTGRKVNNPDMLERIRLIIIYNLLQYHPESRSPEVFGLKDPEKKLDIEIGTHIQVKEDGPKRSLLCIETEDRPGLLVEIIQVLADVNIDVESAEIDTKGLIAMDKFHVSYGGAALIRSMSEVLVNCLRYYLLMPKIGIDSF